MFGAQRRVPAEGNVEDGDPKIKGEFAGENGKSAHQESLKLMRKGGFGQPGFWLEKAQIHIAAAIRRRKEWT
jgi:hypothetical protein